MFQNYVKYNYWMTRLEDLLFEKIRQNFMKERSPGRIFLLPHNGYACAHAHMHIIYNTHILTGNHLDIDSDYIKKTSGN